LVGKGTKTLRPAVECLRESDFKEIITDEENDSFKPSLNAKRKECEKTRESTRESKLN